MTHSVSNLHEAQTVIVGVDTHKHMHVAVAIDSRGIRLGAHSFGADSAGYRALLAWAEAYGGIEAVGIEGTGGYGVGLSRTVHRAGHRVVEVNRVDRRLRRAAGKSDTIDAEAAARAVLEADGRLALVIANSQRLPGPILRGEELDKSLSAGRTDSAGMIFVDPAGNEVGGLIHRTVIAADDAYTASRSLTFDQHQQDQVVGISYFDNGSIRTAGFNVWDRPTTIALEEIMDSNTPDRQAIEQRFVELMRERGLTSGGARRVFLGSQDKTVALRLMDPEGRERIRISVDSNSNARPSEDRLCPRMFLAPSPVQVWPVASGNTPQILDEEAQRQ